MAAISIQVPYPVFYDRDGQPLDNGNIYIGVANLDPVTNQLQVYYDEALTQTASQPLKTSGGYVYRNGTPTQLYVNANNFSITVNDSKNLLVYNFPDGTGLGVEASAIEYDPPFTGAVTSGYTVADKLSQTLSVKDFGATGDGTTDDTVAMTAFFVAASGNSCFIPAGTYKLTSLISQALSNCVIRGVPGQTKITGSFDYAIIQLLDCQNVQFENIIFETTYVNAVQDTGKSVVYSYASAIEVSFRNCTFTSPDANTSGLTFYVRTGPTDTTGTIDGLWIEDCIFEDIGRIGCTIMMRNPSTPEAAQRVYFNRNKGNNLGLSGSYGFLVSFDGYGRTFSCNENVVTNALGIGIENTVWTDGDFIGNQFGASTTLYDPFSFSNVSGLPMTNLRVMNNKYISPLAGKSGFFNVDDSYFSGNSFDTAGAYAAIFRNCNRNRFFGERYTSNGIYAMYVENSVGQTVTGNEWIECFFDNSGSASNFATIRFYGSGVTDNVVRSPVILKGTGGSIVDQTNSAVDNIVLDYRTAIKSSAFQYFTNGAMADADYTFSSQNQTLIYTAFRFIGTLTANRTVNFPAASNYQAFWFYNNTNFTLTLTPSGGTGPAVTSGSRVYVVSNGTDFQT